MLLRRICRRLISDDPYSKIKAKETGREFYLSPNKFYMYTPKEEIVFDNGKALVYKNTSHTLKIYYLPKVMFIFLFASWLYTPNMFLNITPIALCLNLLLYSIGFHALFGSRILTHIYLHLDGKSVDLRYRLCPFVFWTKTYKITDFANKKINYFNIMYTLSPIPKNLLGFMECNQKDLFPLYWQENSWRFFILARNPSVLNEDLFPNITNGVQIDTSKFRGRVNFFRERYVEIKPDDN